MSTQPEPGQAVEVKMPPPAVVKPTPAPVVIGERGVELRDFEQLQRVATMVLASGMAPKDFDNIAKISVAMLRLMELGMNPITGLDCMAVVNGRPVLWGQGPLSLVQKSGLMLPGSFAETFENSKGERIEPAGMPAALKGGDLIAVSRAQRVGGDKGEGLFSVQDAQRAGLWGKTGPWSQYPADMLRYKARARLLKNLFADVLRGTAIKEDLDVPAEAPKLVVESPRGNSASLSAAVARITKPSPPPVDKLAEKHADDGWDTPIETLEEAHPESEMPDFRTGNLPGFDDDASAQNFSSDPGHR